MQHLEVSGAVRHIYICVIRRLKVKVNTAILIFTLIAGARAGPEQ